MASQGVFKPEESKWINRALVLFMLVFQAALFYSLVNGPVILQDSEEFLNSSLSFQKDDNFYSGHRNQPLDYRQFSKRTPLYPLIISSLQSNQLHINYLYIIQIFVQLASLFIGFVLLKNIHTQGKLPIVFMSVFILLTPSVFIYTQFIMADIWLQFFCMLTALSLLKYLKKRSLQWMIALILFSTLAALTKPVFLLASFALALLCGYQVIKSTKKYWLIFCFTPFVSWYGISKMNKQLTGVFHYSAIGYINLLHYNTNLFLVAKSGNAEAGKQLEPLMTTPRSKTEFKKNYREVNTQCGEILLKNGFSYSIYHLKGVIYFFLDPGRFDLYNFFRLETNNSQGFLHKGTSFQKVKGILSSHPVIGILLLLVFIGNLLKTIGFLGFIWINRSNRIVLFLASIVLYVALLTGPLGASRFALPVSLIVIAMASLFYKNLWDTGAKNFRSTENKPD